MSLKHPKNSCATCGEVAAAFTCRGCSENFCLLHTNEHRQGLEKQMNQIVLTHNHLKTEVIAQTTEQFCHSFLRQIEQWEQQSIDKVRQVANDTRQQVLTTIQHRTDNLKEKIATLTQQLNKARKDGGYFEADLDSWTEKLQKLQQLFREQQKVQIYQETSTIPFISKISLIEGLDDTFTNPIPNIPYGSHYQDIKQDYCDDYLMTRDRSEYSSGSHSIRFKIEQYGPNSSFLLGIISKPSSQSNNPYENPTFYGWGEKNRVYRGGDVQYNYHGYKTYIRTDDLFTLNMDCARETISLTNERTGRTNVLDVDITKCPFPWQPNVRFLSDS